MSGGGSTKGDLMMDLINTLGGGSIYGPTARHVFQEIWRESETPFPTLFPRHVDTSIPSLPSLRKSTSKNLSCLP